MRLIDAESAMDGATLFDWYISSVGDGTPVWTEEHIDELLGDFLVIPINTPAMDECIKCSERMPEKNGKYLVYRRTYGFDVVLFDKDVVKDGFFPFGYRDEYKDELGYTACDWYEIDDVTHWMPLPEPPKEVNDQ